MTRVFLVRHGENPANLTKEFSCRRVDYPLTPKGVLQAEQAAAHLEGKGITGIFSSPLKRAKETAGIIAERLGLGVTVVETFREIDVGGFEDLPPSAELWRQHNEILDAWFSGRREVRFPGGENHRELADRMRLGLEEAMAGTPAGAILIVGHGGQFTLTLPELCPSVEVAWLRRQDNANASITELLVHRVHGRLQGQLVAWASQRHLHGAAADLVSGVPDETTVWPETPAQR